MPTQSQILIDGNSKAISPKRTYGDRNQASLDLMFPGSPVYTNLLTDDGLKETYDQIINGKPTDALQSGTGLTYGGGSGFGLASFDTNYISNGAPDIGANAATKDGKQFGKGEGAPTTPYVPPLTSPGVGSVAAADQPPYDIKAGPLLGYDSDGKLEAQNEFGSGYGSTANPAVTSDEIDNQSLGTLISGRSYTNSDTLG